MILIIVQPDSINMTHPNFQSMSINLQQLITFERIVREGSFSAAVESLDISQGTISARIKTLEQTLGGQLFYRQGRKITLTDLGQTFLPYAQRTIEILSEGVEMAHQAKQGQRGRVTYGGLSSLSGALVGAAVAEFHRRHPHVELSVKGSEHETIVSWLRDRVIEFGFVVWPCPESILTPMQPLLRLQERVVLAVNADHSFAKKGAITYEELLTAAHPFLSLRWWKTMHREIVKIAEQSESITVSMDSARYMVRSGTGMSFFPLVYIQDDLKRGTLVEVKIQDFEPLTRESALVWLPRERPLSMAAEAFIDCLHRQAVKLAIQILPN